MPGVFRALSRVMVVGVACFYWGTLGSASVDREEPSDSEVPLEHSAPQESLADTHEEQFTRAMEADDESALQQAFLAILSLDASKEDVVTRAVEVLRLLIPERRWHWELSTMEGWLVEWAETQLNPTERFFLWNEILRLREETRQQSMILQAVEEMVDLVESGTVDRRDSRIGEHVRRAMLSGARAAMGAQPEKAFAFADALLREVERAGRQGVELIPPEPLAWQEMRSLRARLTPPGDESIETRQRDLRNAWEAFAGVDSTVSVDDRITFLRRATGVAYAELLMQLGEIASTREVLVQLRGLWGGFRDSGGDWSGRGTGLAADAVRVAKNLQDGEDVLPWLRLQLAEELEQIRRSFRVGSAQRRAAQTYGEIAQIHAQQEAWSEAIESQQQRVALLTALTSAFPHDLQLAEEWTRGLQFLAEWTFAAESMDEADAVFWHASEVLQEVSRGNPRDVVSVALLTRLHLRQAAFLQDHDAAQEAGQIRDLAMEVLEDYAIQPWLDVTRRTEAADFLTELAEQRRGVGQVREAYHALQRARRLMELMRDDSAWGVEQELRLTRILRALASISVERQDWEGAVEFLERSWSQSRQLREQPVRYANALLSMLTMMVQVQRELGNPMLADSALTEAQLILEGALQSRDRILEPAMAAGILRMLGDRAMDGLRYEEAIRFYREEADWLNRIDSGQAGGANIVALARNQYQTARAYQALANWLNARAALQRGIDLLTEEEQGSPTSEQNQILSRLWFGLGEVMEVVGERAAARDALARSLQLTEANTAAAPLSVEDRQFLLDLLLRKARLSEAMGEIPDALHAYAQVYRIQRPRFPRPVPMAEPLTDPRILARRISLLAKQHGFYGEAVAFAEEEADILRAYLFQQPEIPLWQMELLWVRLRLAEIAWLRGEFTEASRRYDELEQELIWFLEEHPDDPRLQIERARLQFRRGQIASISGDQNRARDLWRQAAGFLETIRNTGAQSPEILLQLADIYHALAESSGESPREQRLRDEYQKRVQGLLNSLEMDFPHAEEVRRQIQALQSMSTD